MQGEITIVLRYDVEPDSYPATCKTVQEMVKYDERSYVENEVNLEDLVSWTDKIVSVTFTAVPADPGGTEPLPGV